MVTDAFLNDAANSDALMNTDSRIDLGGADASISAPIAIDNPTELRGPDIEGVVIQPALAEHPESGLWLAFTYMADVGGGILPHNDITMTVNASAKRKISRPMTVCCTMSLRSAHSLTAASLLCGQLMHRASPMGPFRFVTV